MSQVLYQASPSLVRMNPFGSVLLILMLLGGVLVATPPVANTLGANLRMPSAMVSLVGMAAAALAFLWLLIWYIKTKMDHLAIKSDELIWTHGLLSKRYTEIAQTSIRAVRVEQSLLQRIMGAGDVYVFTSGDLPEVVIRGLPDPELVRQYTSAAERD